jgi:hypothetical protein
MNELVETTPVTDLYAEGLDRIEILGDNVRTIYWRWKWEGGTWQRVALDFALIRPIKGLTIPMHLWKARIIVKPPDSRNLSDLLLH